jgi:CrcB protein
VVQFLFICLGGAVGTGARYALATWCARAFGTGFPYGTLAVNVIGSFLLGAIMQLSISTDLMPPSARLTLGTGVMGGFTTYSTFNYETLKYFDERAFGLGALNMLATGAGCLTAGLLGVAMVRKVFGP